MRTGQKRIIYPRKIIQTEDIGEFQIRVDVGRGAVIPGGQSCPVCQRKFHHFFKGDAIRVAAFRNSTSTLPIKGMRIFGLCVEHEDFQPKFIRESSAFLLDEFLTGEWKARYVGKGGGKKKVSPETTTPDFVELEREVDTILESTPVLTQVFGTGIPTAKAKISIQSEPSGASVYVDGGYVGDVTPVEYKTEPGDHKILIRKDGFYDRTINISLGMGEVFSQRVVLQKLPRVVYWDPGFYEIGCFHSSSSENPGAQGLLTGAWEIHPKLEQQNFEFPSQYQQMLTGMAAQPIDVGVAPVAKDRPRQPMIGIIGGYTAHYLRLKQKLNSCGYRVIHLDTINQKAKMGDVPRADVYILLRWLAGSHSITQNITRVAEGRGARVIEIRETGFDSIIRHIERFFTNQKLLPHRALGERP